MDLIKRDNVPKVELINLDCTTTTARTCFIINFVLLFLKSVLLSFKVLIQALKHAAQTGQKLAWSV
jgi:hypothetical protein